ncbi:hypothetical protein AAFC00_003281 [Neodothiora populina]|uniref:Protein-serine/threonine kinase n=1 Tax=Neodothiora populina TaxID=2781224 RepID=A0ABR3PAL8_9PEZI
MPQRNLLRPSQTTRNIIYQPLQSRQYGTWRRTSVLDEWVDREARPVSLRQLTFFGRVLTEGRLLGSANYVREELPTRLAHRIRNIENLPYSALLNPHIAHVYELYNCAFEKFRRVPEIKTLEDNDRFCDVMKECLTEHLSVIPRLAMGVLEIQDSVRSEDCDRLMTTLLRARISRRVIAEQHLALTETFHSPWHFPQAPKTAMTAPEDDLIGEVLLKCSAKDIIEKCTETVRKLTYDAYGQHVELPEVRIRGHLDTTFPYIPSHLEYIIGELLRNSFQAAMERSTPGNMNPIEVLICEAAQHVLIRVSDQCGGVDREVLPYLWSFSKGPRRHKRLENLQHVPRLAATLQELQMPPDTAKHHKHNHAHHDGKSRHDSSLLTLTGRHPDLRLGIGLPMSRIYAEYWAGSLELHSLEGYGVDAFLSISKLGNKNEVLSTRASMDAI